MGCYCLQSVEDSASQQPALVMTADSLDLSAVTPVAAQTKKGQEGQGKSHSTPIDAADQSYLGLHQPPVGLFLLRNCSWKR